MLRVLMLCITVVVTFAIISAIIVKEAQMETFKERIINPDKQVNAGTHSKDLADSFQSM